MADLTTSSRLEAFSDAIIAVAATLLVIDLKLPPEKAEQGLWAFLADQVPTFAAYVTSFFTILIFWINHHTLFRSVRQVDRAALFLNGALLLSISFISYATSILGTALASGRQDRQAAVFYGAVLLLSSSCFTLLWRHLVSTPKLLLKNSRADVSGALRRSAIGPILYFLACGVALLSPRFSLLLDIAIAGHYAVLPRRTEVGSRP
ncbi:TMEM175 family protein [Streptomyces sp. NPDC090080]|uniref:TMEM175 family protein n=1 Tax=Streptomyces sp. NPDC090080 TaxID=3365939 RepID=UPI00380CBDBD